MLLRYTFENFKSFAESASFEMLAPKNKIKNRFPDNFVTLETGDAVLKEAFIVGENAGGKTNFVTSLNFFQRFFISTEEVRGNSSFINNRKNQETSTAELVEVKDQQAFAIEIAIGSTVYLYNLLIDAWGIRDERLVKKAGQKTTVVFTAARKDERFFFTEDKRDDSDDSSAGFLYAYTSETEAIEELLGSIDSGEGDEVQPVLGLFITKLALLGQADAVVVSNWMKNRLIVITNSDAFLSGDVLSSGKKEAMRIMNSPEYLEIFRLVDTSIIKIAIDEDRPSWDSLVTRRDGQGHEYTQHIKEDSRGVREFFAWALYIYLVVYENKVLFADEIDSVLNPILAERIVTYVNGKKHQGQFIFTTHNVLHLTLRTYMKEQIYFATKDKESLTSSLYSLAEFDDIRYDLKTEIYEFYLKGVLGGTAYE